jgi:hypothetical protein
MHYRPKIDTIHYTHAGLPKRHLGKLLHSLPAFRQRKAKFSMTTGTGLRMKTLTTESNAKSILDRTALHDVRSRTRLPVEGAEGQCTPRMSLVF